MKKFRLPLILFFLFLILTACGKSDKAEVNVGPPPITVMGQEIDIRAIASKLNNYRQVGIRDYENPIVKMWASYVLTLDEYIVGASEIMAVGENCFVDQAQAQAYVVSAALGNVDQNGMINALVSDNLTGSEPASECAAIYSDLADYVMAHRAAIKNEKLKVINMTVDYETYFTEWVEVDAMNDLLQVYGDAAVVYQQLEDHGVDLPGTTDITWLPSRLLLVTHTDFGVCDYYMSGAYRSSLDSGTRAKFKDHPEALDSMFEATWIAPEHNGGVGECTMYRWAAIKWMQRTSVSSATNSSIEGGSAPIFNSADALVPNTEEK